MTTQSNWGALGIRFDFWNAGDLYLAGNPDQFRVEYVINDHMDIDGWKKDPAGILSSIKAYWNAVSAQITGSGNRIIVAPANKLYPDSIFAADSCLAWIDEQGKPNALISSFKHPERQGEEQVWKDRLLPAAGFNIVQSISKREGSGDSLFDPNYGIWWTGVGQRTDVGAGEQQSQVTGRTVIELQTQDGSFYHVDTFLAFLPKGHAVVFRDAMHPKDQQTLCDFYSADKRLELTKDEAMSFAANMQVVTNYNWRGKIRSHTILLPQDTPQRVSDVLKGWGYKVQPVDVSGVRLSGGGSHCCFQRVWNLKRYAEKALPSVFLQRLKVDDTLQSSVWRSAKHEQALSDAVRHNSVQATSARACAA